MRRVAITVDVEAHLHRADRNHVDRLIWGRQNGREAGIQTMMDIANRHGVPMTFFLDYPEAELYGEELLDVGREIYRRGHDLEPHCHTEYLMRPLFALEDPLAVRVTRASLSQALNIADYLVERHVQLTGKQPLAHRSGAYMLGSNYLKALRQRGFLLDASYNPLCPEDPMRLGVYGAFRWQNGLRELPIPLVAYFRHLTHLVPWNFNSSPFIAGTLQENLQAHRDFLNTWFRRHGDDAIATLVLHSWSFWKMDANGHFTIPAEDTPELFDALLTKLQEEYDIISVGQIAEEEKTAPAPLETVEVRATAPVCPVCYEPVSHFQDYNGPKHQCPFCHSVERHRTLVDLVYQGAFGPGVFHNKDILHIAPGRPEKLLLRRMYQCRITTLDILPGCDLCADLQAMPEVPDNSYDVVLACGVFQHVRHLEQALAEIARILRPGGLLLCSDILKIDHTREVTDRTEQSAWYGEEKLHTYGIGLFRCFGYKDWEKAFIPLFFTRLFKAVDEATGSPAWWLACTPKPLTSPREPQQTEPVMTDALLRSNAGRILLDAAHDPLQKFLPAFHSWEEYRRTSVASDLTWLKKIIFSLHFTKFGPQLANPLQKADFPPSYPQGTHPFPFQSFAYLLSDLPSDSAFGDSQQLRHLVSETERWIDTYGCYAQSVHMDAHTRSMVWHDTATTARLAFMAYILLRILPVSHYQDTLVEKIFRSALDHFLLLCADHFFTGRHNHGLFQILGLLAFASAWPGVNGTRLVQEISAARLKKLLEVMLSPDGMVREHSPEYHAVILPLLDDIAKFLTDPNISSFLSMRITHVRSAFTHFIRPNGSLCPFGDTPPEISPFIEEESFKAYDRCAALPPLALFPQSGYAFLRIRQPDESHKEASYIAFQGAFYSLVHKHCDDLSFIWSEGKENLLIDSGMQYGYEGKLSSGPLLEKGFYYSVPNRVYCESVHAHNCVEINGTCYSRNVKPYGALPFSGCQLPENRWMLEGTWQRPEGFLQKRTLVFSPARWLLVMDDLQPLSCQTPCETTFSQWFHFDATLIRLSQSDTALCLRLPDQRQLHCQNLAAGQISTHYGEVFPRLQAWQATENYSCLTPAWTMGIHVKCEAARFTTLLSLIGPCREGEAVENGYLLRFAHGEIERILWGDAEHAEARPAILP